MERKAAKGKWTGGTVAYGYQLDRSCDILVPNPFEASVVRQIFTTYAEERCGTRAIADRLNQRGLRTRFGKPWSGVTITNLLSNRTYIEDKVFGDISVTDAHQPIIAKELFQQVQAILTSRSEPGSKRRACNSDYSLTGLITCPACGLKYIGTSATGRARIYRYYTCFSRIRYGRHGCDGPRLPADELDQAVVEALLQIYTKTDIITQAIALERQLRTGKLQALMAERSAVTQESTAAQEAIDRYLIAFEQGRLDADICGKRVAELRARLALLSRRHQDLEHRLTEPPSIPSEKAITELRQMLWAVFKHGTPGQRKAIIEINVEEITVEGDQIIPVFRLPEEATEPVENSTGSQYAVRVLPTMAPPLGLEPRTCRLTAGCSAN